MILVYLLEYESQSMLYFNRVCNLIPHGSFSSWSDALSSKLTYLFTLVSPHFESIFLRQVTFLNTTRNIFSKKDDSGDGIKVNAHGNLSWINNHFFKPSSFLRDMVSIILLRKCWHMIHLVEMCIRIYIM